MLYVQQFLQTLCIELAGVACMTGVLYVFWNRKRKNY